MTGHWEGRAEYADGTSVERTFPYREGASEDDQQYDIECWLIEHKPDCVWYTANFVYDYEEE